MGANHWAAYIDTLSILVFIILFIAVFLLLTRRSTAQRSTAPAKRTTVADRRNTLFIKFDWFIALVWLGLSLVAAGLLAVPDIQHGKEPVAAYWHVLGSDLYWYICISLFMLAGIIARVSGIRPRRMKPAHERQQEDVSRWIVIVLVFVLLAMAIPELIALASKSQYTVAFFTKLFSSVFWVLYAMYYWLDRSNRLPGFLKKPTDYDQLVVELDERFQLVWEKAAATTLYWVLGLVFVFGSLYDILLTRRWPVRSVGEVMLILVIWTVAYRYWEKRL